ncbi:cupin domain-containing protein [Thiorhodococcus mannitoliphagus]|uniref:Cupin domain-containing protein n=1 Tax=Thiorhodococcus mannitoliphagus TaxID=329406 RepID=A0A6P1DRZ5_9GAMM|nr:cupin domain-containing protein [Thiorhodococcus mannitoliphagus]NEX19943.1 cupin domain-containing protein [Thiorhodococcus mannitoliphagus]
MPLSDDDYAIDGNLFAALPQPIQGEVFEDLLRCGRVKIERIVSSDQPEPTLYEQVQDEWVCLLQGRATLEIAGEEVALGAGDFRFIPAHTPHRVLGTSREPRCLWLAIHLFSDPEAA